MKLKTNLNKLLGNPDAEFEIFHRKTKQTKISAENLDPAKWPKEWKIVQFKAYGRLAEVVLPKPRPLINNSLQSALHKRSSYRKFSRKPLPISKLSSLLYFAAGLKDTKNPETSGRFYPSAGSRYPLETYLISLNSSLPKGLYHYYLKNHSLEKLLTFDPPAGGFAFKHYFNQNWIYEAGALIIITAVFKRTSIKYADRGYRHILQESGHLGQNIYLLSAALDLGCCAIGGYADDKLNKLLDIDGLNEAVIYVLAVGTAKVQNTPGVAVK